MHLSERTYLVLYISKNGSRFKGLETHDRNKVSAVICWKGHWSAFAKIAIA